MSTLTILRLPTEYAGRFHPAVRELARRVRPQAVGLSTGGLVRRAAALAKAHGRFEDRHLVHLNDLELAELERAWGPPHVNPHTGLPEYSFFSDIGSIAGDILGGASGIGGILAPVAQLASAFMGGTQPSYMPNQANQGLAGPSSNYMSSYGQQPVGNSTAFNVGTTPVSWGNLLNVGGDLLGFVGALNRNRAAQKATKQSKQAYADFIGPHVDYHMGDNPTTVTGLAPSGPVETAGFRPEDTLTRSTTPMAMGGLPQMPTGALSQPPWHTRLPSPGFRPRPVMPMGQFPRGYAAAGQVGGEGGGQDDRVPAYLSQDEYVMPADVVSHLGDGSSNEGARRLDELVKRVRERRTGNDRFPPTAGALTRRVA